MTDTIRSVHVLTTEQRLDIVASLRIRAHELSQDAELTYATPATRAEWLAESARLTELARLLEGKQISVAHPDRGHAS